MYGLAKRVAGKIPSPPIVYASGEEMTRYAMDLVLKRWVEPHVDTSKWEFYDLSAKNRDDTSDKVLQECIEAGKRIGSIFKEPTVTPTEVQRKQMGLKKLLGSPNGAMRRGWNGITISRDTIHIEGMDLGYKKPVIFERHAVGGEYDAGFGMVGRGRIKTIYYPEHEHDDDDDDDSVVIAERKLADKMNAVVTYHNPLDNVHSLAHIFFQRALKYNVTPYVVTKKTVFKWQEEFWTIMKGVFDKEYRDEFRKKGLLNQTGGELQHLISDAATMQIIRWTDGGFGMAAHNYDGDMLTDELAQVHRSPGFITSNLVGKNLETGQLIKAFEASHGTVSDMWHDHLEGKPTSLNPLGLVEALIGAMNHAVALQVSDDDEYEDHDLVNYTSTLRKALHRAMVVGKGTKDLCGEEGLTTEAFVDYVGDIIEGKLTPVPETEDKRLRKPSREKSIQVNEEAMRKFFNDLDKNGDNSIDFEEFSEGMIRLGVYPRAYFLNKGS